MLAYLWVLAGFDIFSMHLCLTLQDSKERAASFPPVCNTLNSQTFAPHVPSKASGQALKGFSEIWVCITPSHCHAALPL